MMIFTGSRPYTELVNDVSDTCPDDANRLNSVVGITQLTCVRYVSTAAIVGELDVFVR